MEERPHKGGHIGATYTINGLLVCENCHPRSMRGGNECFCSCHIPGAKYKFCGKCARFHQGDN